MTKKRKFEHNGENYFIKTRAVKMKLKNALKQPSDPLLSSFKDASYLLSWWSYEVCVLANCSIAYILEQNLPLPDVSKDTFWDRCFDYIRDAHIWKQKYTQQSSWPSFRQLLLNDLNAKTRKRQINHKDEEAVKRRKKSVEEKRKLNEALVGVLEYVIKHWNSSNLPLSKLSDFPEIKQTIRNQLMQNAETHLWYKVEQRAKQVMALEPRPKEIKIWQIMKAWRKGLTTEESWPEKLKTLILEHREKLGCVQGEITDKWLKSNPSLILKYQWWLLQKQEKQENQGKRFSLLPLHSFTRIHL